MRYKSKKMTLQPSDFETTHKQQPSKAPRWKRPNVLIPKQKLENEMTRTFFKKSNKKESLVRNRGEIQIPKASKKTQQSPKLTQQHLIFPKKQKIRAYVTVLSKPAYIHDYSRKTHLYKWLWKKNLCTWRKR